jgi:hypothetical protein
MADATRYSAELRYAGAARLASSVENAGLGIADAMRHIGDRGYSGTARLADSVENAGRLIVNAEAFAVRHRQIMIDYPGNKKTSKWERVMDVGAPIIGPLAGGLVTGLACTVM